MRFRYESFDEYWEITRELGGAIWTRSPRCPTRPATPCAQRSSRARSSSGTAGGYELPGLCHNAVSS